MLEKGQIDLPDGTEEKFTRLCVQCEEWNVKVTAFFQWADLLYNAFVGLVIQVNRLVKMVAYLDDASECDRSKTEIVADIRNNSKVLSRLCRQTVWQITATGTAQRNAIRQFRHLDSQRSLRFVVHFTQK